MRLPTFYSIFAILFMASTLNAQTISSSDNSGGHPCGGSSRPYYLTAPKGTISYYDFVSNLGVYYKDGDAQFGKYDTKTNEFRPAPSVAFGLNNFFTVELGSMYTGRTNKVMFGIRADECEDVVLHKTDGSSQFIASISAYLRFSTEKSLDPKDAGAMVDSFAKPFLEALARRDGKVLVIARPVGYSWQSSGDRMRYLKIEFEIEDYHIVQ